MKLIDEQILTMPLLALSGSQRSLRGVPIEAVIHSKSYTACASARERMLSAAQRALLKTGAFSQLNFVSFLQYEQALARKLPLAKMARAAGDPVPQAARIARESARSQMGLRPDGRLIGMIGGLDERKAVPATLSAFRASRLSSSDRLLLAGKLAPGFAQLIQRDYSDLVQRGALIVMDRYLDEGELANCFAAVNLHCSVYNDFSGLSSLMLKSVAAGIPVIVSDRPGWSRAVVRRFGVGSVVDPTDTDSFARGLRDALESSESYRESEAVRRLLRFHSIANFTEGITGRLRSLLGKSASTQVVEWCWVSEALDPANRALT
jgi:glycosyltransferase involved in cell wall biosynthesis